MKRTIADIRENLPFVGCDNDTATEMLDEIEWLRTELAKTIQSKLSPEELKLVDKHCDWVAFTHAWNAVMKRRGLN